MFYLSELHSGFLTHLSYARALKLQPFVTSSLALLLTILCVKSVIKFNSGPCGHQLQAAIKSHVAVDQDTKVRNVRLAMMTLSMPSIQMGLVPLQ